MTSRLTSHSHGANPASSKSLRSNRSRRSGEAKRPKFDRRVTAGQDDVTTVRGAREVCSHERRSPPVEGERRLQHASDPDRDEFLQARCVLLLDDRHRIEAVGREE